MARIMTVSEQEARERFPEILAATKQAYGLWLGVRGCLWPYPEVGSAARQLYEFLHLRPSSPLSRLQRAMLATVCYGLIGGKACLGLHSEALRRLTRNARLGPEFAHTWPTYELDAPIRALLSYARTLTETPYAVDDSEIQALRASGWSEQGIYEATALIAFYSFTGRLEAAADLPPDEPLASVSFPEAIPDGR